jgi:hypothetical protein
MKTIFQDAIIEKNNDTTRHIFMNYKKIFESELTKYPDNIDNPKFEKSLEILYFIIDNFSHSSYSYIYLITNYFENKIGDKIKKITELTQGINYYHSLIEKKRKYSDIIKNIDDYNISL